MNRITAGAVLTLLLGSMLVPVQAQEHGRGVVHVPDSSFEDPSDAGERAHTNHRHLIGPNLGKGPGGGMTPGQLEAFYKLTVDGSHHAIAIVDAFDYPNARRDFNIFSTEFNLQQELSIDVTDLSNPVLTVVYQGVQKPIANTDWAQESALDIQWAHALAPKAKIFLVEAQSNSFADLMAAVDIARSLPGVKQISMSWGGSEFSSQSYYDSHFNVSGPLFFAASGDTGGKTIYPSASPYVVAVGGTSVATKADGSFVSETGWSGAGGGPSKFYSKPSWQKGIANTGRNRSIPDLASDSDPYTGVSVYAPLDGATSEWMVFGGTSVATPCIAAMVNRGGMTYNGSTTDFLTAIYSSPAGNFRDILTGSAGKYSCKQGWDFVTGLGSPQGTGF